MSLHTTPPNPVPEETARVARASFPNGNTYMRMRDRFGALFSDDTFVTLFPSRGQPAEAPARLALITILQFAEDCRIFRPQRPCGRALPPTTP